MKAKQNQPANAAELRRRAEERLSERRKSQRSKTGDQSMAEDAARLVHELQVHQIELEMQNEELRASQTKVEAGLALYADLYDFAPTGYMTFDREGVIRLVNLTVALFLGVERSRLVKRRFSQFVTEGDRRVFSRFLEKVFASETKEHCEVTLPREGSQPLVIHIEATRSTDAQECRAVMMDITERKRVEQALRESELKHRMLFETANDAIMLMRQDRFIACNVRTLLLFGCSRDQIVGASPQKFSPPMQPDGRSSAEKALEKINMALTEGPQFFEWEHCRAEGTPFTAEVSLNRLELGGEVLIQAIARDVTERKHAEEALERERNLLRTLIDHIPDSIYVRDTANRFLLANETVAKRMGAASPADLIGKTDADFYPAEQAAHFADLDREVLAGRALVNFEEDIAHLDGKRRTVLSTKVPLKDAQGAVTALVGIGRDITERKRAEANQRLVLDALQLLNRPNNLNVLVEELIVLIKGRTGFDAVGLRIRQGEDFPYCVQNGFSDAFVREENSLCAKDREGIIVRDAAGHAVLECMCGNILCGRTNPALPFFTEWGSFWTNSTTQLLASTTEADRQSRTRNRCNTAGYESVALVPLRSGDDIVGLLQLNDHQKGRFTPELIRFFEGLAASVGIALKRRQDQEAVQTKAREWQTTFDAVNDAIWLLDKDQRIVRCNRATEKLVNRPCSEVLGRHCWELVHGTSQPVPECPISRAAQSLRRETTELRIGQGFFEICVDPIVDKAGQFAGAVHIVSDITKRKQTEAEVVRLNLLYATLSQINRSIVRVKSHEELFQEVCRVTAEFGGFKVVWVGRRDPNTQQVVPVARGGHDAGYLDKIKVYADDRPEGHGPVGTCIRENRPCVFKDFLNAPETLPWHQQALAHGLQSAAALPIHFKGEVWGAFTVYDGEANVFQDKEVALLEETAMDISFAMVNLEKEAQRQAAEAAQRKSEEEVRKLNADLEQRVVERTTELEAANQELEAFSYSVSHDLRAPLRAINGFAHILAEDHAKHLNEEGHRTVGVICAEIKRMEELIDDLLEFSRMVRQEIQPAEVDMGALAQAAFDECAAQAPDRKFQFKLHPLPPARGDSILMREVWINLISNAIKYTRRKDVAIIEIGGRAEDDTLFYHVKDNGAGFDMRYVKKLFGVFQRLHTAEEFEGTGVGLALVQRIVVRHGGRVWAEGKVNEGATFHFALPRPVESGS